MAAGLNLDDIDGLTREVDNLCSARDWEGLLGLRDLCRAALERGKQLWPVAAHAEYRLALEAPAAWAAQMLVPGTGRFALGPIPEVAASTHTWDELAPHAPPGPVAALAAHERVVRGDDVTGADVEPVLELPLSLQAWEPTYSVAEYSPDKADFPTPTMPRCALQWDGAPGERIEAPDAVRALSDLAEAWVTESNGRAEAVAVEGDVGAAIAALGPRAIHVALIEPAVALAHMAWTAASGGAHGRRRGMAKGRFAAWWAVAALTDALDDWPLPPDEMGELAAELRWCLWDAGEPATGWSLRLAVEDPETSRAFALSASDAG